MSNKKLITIIIFLFIMLMAIGGTIAYFTWASNNDEKTNVALTFITESEDLTCSADGGGDITSNDLKLAPTNCTNKKYAIQRTVTLSTTQKSGTEANLSLWLKVNSISQNLANTPNFKYALTTNANSCTTGVVNSGTFQGATANSELTLIDEKTYEQSTSNDTYYLYIWLDEAETNLNTMSQSFNFSLGGECTDTPAKVGKPELTDGLIPVTIANDGTVTAVSKTDPTWYDYDNQVWANAVLTTSTNRSIYQSIANGNADSQAIPSNEILAYYVWIPRYSYKIWTLDASQAHTGDEQTIDIKIVDKSTKERGTTVGSYYTHPAFTFGNDELSGFWVGKFEATGTASQPTILPNTNSLRDQNVSTQFATSLKFAGGTQSGSAVTFAGSSTYGLTNKTDTHMMKNSEWGAVAYLSHSNYGINEEIRINNYWNNNQTLTGCGASTANASESATCGIAYGSTTSYPQSTTGNITGIFDMAGGAWEYVMSHWSDNLNASGETSGFSTLPTSKYIDIYPSNVFTGNSSTNIALCTLSTCGGHALYETTNWYSDSSYFANSNYPWFIRGGERSFIDYAGLSSFNSDDGGVDTYNSWHSTLIPNVTPTIPTFTITLDNDSATTNGTTTLYGKYNDGIYLDNNYQNKMTTGLNSITIPQRTNYIFGGYYDGNTKMIDEDGYITNSLTNTLYSQDKILNARWLSENGVILYNAKYVSNDETYPNGTWTKDSVYVDLSITSTNKTITTFQYSLNAGGTWADLTCAKSNGITHSDNIYGCQQVWTTTGNSSITFRALDSNNDPSTISATLNLKYDTVAPSGSVSTSIAESMVTATISASDNLSGLSEHYYFKTLSTDTCGTGTEGTTNFIDNEDSDTYSFNAQEETDYYICARVSDNAGNEAYISKRVNISDKVYLKALPDATDFKSGTYKDKIQKIQVVNYINLTNSVANWDMANDGTNSIKGWVTSNTSNTSNYDLYIGSDSKIYATNLYNYFYSMNYVSNINLSGLHTDEVISMKNMFWCTGQNATNLNLNLGDNFNTSNVTDMSQMFYRAGHNATNFSLNLGNNFNTSKVTNMASMFYRAGHNATNFSLNLGNHFNTSNVTNMYSMFEVAGSYATTWSLNLGNNFNTSNVTNMVSMFDHAGGSAVTWNLSLGNHFNTSNATDMRSMFSAAGYSATTWSLDLGNHFNTSKVTIMSNMFSYAGHLSSIWSLDLGNHFNTSNVTNMSNMFSNAGHNATNFSLNLGNHFNTINVTNMANMFYNTGYESTNFNLDLGNYFNTGNVINMVGMFEKTGRRNQNWNLNLGNHFNTSNVTNMSEMFQDAGEHATSWSLNLGNQFYTNNVTNMASMFSNAGQNATNFSLNLGNNFNTSNVTSMNFMFYSAGHNSTDFNLNLGNHFNMSKVANMHGMFNNTAMYVQNTFIIDLSAGNFVNISNYNNMFNGFGNNKATILVKDPDSQNWIISKNSNWGQNFDVYNVLINNINYYLEGGSFSSTPLYTMKGRSESYTLPTPTKAGYTFFGWTGSNGDVPQTTVTIPAGTTEILQYTANWGQSASVPTVSAKYVSDNSTYTAGTWTRDSVYVELSSTTINNNVSVSKFQYSTDNGSTWYDVVCDKSNGITNSGNTYSCQMTWTTNGNSSITFRAVDNSNNATSASTALNLKYDAIAPTGSIAVSIAGTTATAVVTATDSESGIDNSHYYFKLLTTDTCGVGTDGTTGFTDNEDSNAYTFNTDGESTYYACIKVLDNVGHEGYISQAFDAFARAYLKELPSDANFKSSTYKQKIEKIEVVDYINLANSVTNWNMANDGTNSIKGWLTRNVSNSSNYDLYIGSDNQIYATNLYNYFTGLLYANQINLGNLYTNKVTNVSAMFYNTGRNATTFSLNLGTNFNTINVTNMSAMFYNAGLNAIAWDLNLGTNFNTINVTNMYGMFDYAGYNVTNWSLNLGNHFNTSNVTDMYYMFSYAGYRATTWDLNLGTNFNTSNVTNMANMFRGAGYNATNWSLNLGNHFNTSNVTDMVLMFSFAGGNATNWSLNLSNEFNTINVTNMHSMFSYAGSNATNWSLNLGNQFNTINVTNMSGMFHNMGRNATTWSLDLGNHFNTSNVTNMYGMFLDAGGKATNWSLNLGNSFNTSNVTSMYAMFCNVGQNATNWSLNLDEHFDTSNVANMSRMFDGTGQNATNWNLNLGNNFDTSSVVDMSYMLSNTGSCATAWNLNLGEHFYTNNVTNMKAMFYNVGINGNIFNLNLGNSFNTINVTSMSTMFAYAGQHATTWNLNLGEHFNTSNVTSMWGMFEYAVQNVTTWSLSFGNNFNTSNVTTMAWMFRGAGSNATNWELNLGNHFNTSNVTDMSYMFANAGRNATNWSLNLSNEFNTINVTNMSGMFDNAERNATNFDLNLGNHFNTINVTDMSNMFKGIGANVTNWNFDLGEHFNTVNVNTMYGMFSAVGQNATNFSLNLGNHFNTSNVTDMSQMFSFAGDHATNWSLNLGNHFNTSNVTRMYDMFRYAGQNATTFNLNLSDDFNTSNVTNMSGMFDNAGHNATNFDLNLGNHFNTSNVTNMAYMFKWTGTYATNISLNLGNHFNTSNVTNMAYMFEWVGLKALNPFTIDLSAGNFDNVSKYTSMFNNFGNNKATIYVKDSTAQNWIISKKSSWGTNFSTTNVLIK